MADPNQIPEQREWVCPCTGCQKARKKAFKEVLGIIQGGGDAYSKINQIKELVTPLTNLNKK